MSHRITFLDVGNKDSIVVSDESGRSTAVIDSPNLRRLMEFLESGACHHLQYIFFTHDHSDHFQGLVELAAFVTAWIEKGHEVRAVVIPDGVWKVAFGKLHAAESEPRNPANERLKHALTQLRVYERQSKVRIIKVVAGTPLQPVGLIDVEIMHPSLMFQEEFQDLSAERVNEASMVLRLRLGAFSVLLLADIAGDGLVEMRAKLESLNPNARESTVLKVPHHGAWPRNGEDLEALLCLARPAVAVLSVGSKNRYQHVRPELFRLLRRLRQVNPTMRILCTQVTRTCIKASEDCAKMGREGLADPTPCAGNIEVKFDRAGRWQIANDSVHAAHVATLTLAQCRSSS